MCLRIDAGGQYQLGGNGFLEDRDRAGQERGFIVSGVAQSIQIQNQIELPIAEGQLCG